MFFFAIFLRLLHFLIPLSILSTTYLYLYPAFHGCHFPSPGRGQVAPFRLLAFGDPQLEGDTSLPKLPSGDLFEIRNLGEFLRNRDFRGLSDSIRTTTIHGLDSTIYYLKYTRKYIDLLGNDYYLAHIYRTLHWWSNPTHTTVLGDLLGSQWITDEEFERRVNRFWGRVFAGAERTPSDVLNPNKTGQYSTRTEVFGEDPAWSRRIINIPGNHDVGYAGDANEHKISRFEEAFGPVNGDIIFSLPQSSTDDPVRSIRLVILNSMILDGPAADHDLHVSSVQFVNDAMTYASPVESHDTAVVLLTHIPLHKESGICVDEPLFTYLDEVYGGGIKEQNFLAPESSQDAILQGIFGMNPSNSSAARGMGRDGIILTGHDHEGCDVYHYADRETEEWRAQRWSNVSTTELVLDDNLPGIREVTVRSMMGEFGGNTALVSAWWDSDKDRWSFEVSNCQLGVQHIWWAVHSIDFAAIFFSVLTLVAYVFGKAAALPANDRKVPGTKPSSKSSKHRGVPAMRAEKLTQKQKPYI